MIIVIIKTAEPSGNVNIKQVIDSVVWWLNNVGHTLTRTHAHIRLGSRKDAHILFENLYSCLWIDDKSVTRTLRTINLVVQGFIIIIFFFFFL
jgi:hypothetical protein